MQQIISNLISTWQFWWQTGKKLTEQVQRTFSACRMRLSKARIWLGSPGCAGSSTHEAHGCAHSSCPAHFWNTGSAGAQQVCTWPTKCFQDHRCAGKSSLGRPGERWCPEGGRRRTVGPSQPSLIEAQLCYHQQPPPAASPQQGEPSRFTWRGIMGLLVQWRVMPNTDN